MNFVSAIGYALFPLSSAGYDGSAQSFIHVYIVTAAVVLLSIISLILIAVGSFKNKQKALGALAIIALVLMFVGAVGSGNVPKEIFGVFERFSTYSAVAFTGILGVYGFRQVVD
jgi:ABC-type Na+ efflux pump permease subunit